MSEPVRHIMTKNPTCCTPQTPLQEVAKMMVQHDCGCIPVLDGSGSGTPVGTITDRDITCRTLAQGKNPLELAVQDCMTSDCVTIHEDAGLNECVELMEKKKIRRIVVVDSFGKCCGIVSQADIALTGDKKKTGEVVQKVSEPAG
ncbi:CBS domain-containing protein [bacterium]|nr:CBS domain-containing protein [bacterium]MCI0607358.1 CBS domain-containing protein [bacterium]